MAHPPISRCSLRSSCISHFALDNAADAVLWTDPGGAVLYANRSAARLLGKDVDELVGLQLSACAPDLASSVNVNAKQPFQSACVRADGLRIPVEVSVSSFEVDAQQCHCLFLRDVSERNRLELQLRQAHTMEAVGRLADGISHDFNNLLTAVMIYSGLMSNQLSETSPLRPQLDRIMQAAEDGRTLVENLLGLGRKSAGDLVGTPVNLSEHLAGMRQMLARLLGEDILLDIDSPAKVSPVLVDRLQVEQVVLNLAVNARDAMPNGGNLRIRVCDRNVDESFARDRTGLKSGSYVQLEVSDTGCGMDPEILSHIFEPFFTTKSKGRGTGLGMAMVYGIVQQCGGYIELSSYPARGTTVTILLPRAEVAAAGGSSGPLREHETSNSETVLLVEDEDLVRRSIHDILTGSGYRVLQASNADEAVSAADAFGGHIDVMLTDLVLPGKGGLDLAQNIQYRRPDMRVLYMSGYNDDARVRRIAESAEPFCRKPFTPAALSRKLREVLSAPAPSGR